MNVLQIGLDVDVGGMSSSSTVGMPRKAMMASGVS